MRLVPRKVSSTCSITLPNSPSASFCLSLTVTHTEIVDRIQEERTVMVSKSSDSALKTKTGDTLGTLPYKIQQLKKQIQVERGVSIREKLDNNAKQLENYVSQLVSIVTSRNGMSSMENSGLGKGLSSRIENPLCTINGPAQLSGDKDCYNCQEVVFTTSAKLPSIEKMPPYTTWIFLDKNQRMAEDQSVVGRRRIYYDQHGSEALICSDSEEEIAEPEEEKHEFSEGEDRIIWMAFQEHGPDGSVEEVINIVTQFVGGSASEIQERYNMLKQKDEEKHNQNLKVSGEIESERSTHLDKSLTAALDSFDNLFCRRCLVFDCRLHGCSQSLIYSSEKQYYSSDSEEERKPCSDQCYLRLNVAKDVLEASAVDALRRTESKSSKEEEQNLVSWNAENPGKRKILNHAEDSMLVSADPQGFSCKKPKKFSDPDAANAPSENMDTPCGDEPHMTTKSTISSLSEHPSDEFNCPLPDHMIENEEVRDGKKGIMQVPVLELSSDLKGGQVKGESSSCEWKPLEKDLCLKGIEIFGKNSCLIARNLLAGLKTCMEVSRYLYDGVATIPQRPDTAPSILSDAIGKVDSDHMDQEMPTRARLLRRRGRARKLKYSWKSAGHPSMWRRIADGKNQSCKQYTPCGCQSMCGKQCPCLDNGTCCEKYCGCSKSCKNRFRGCHCAKSQCRSRQCPCFAAGRECDPDVCRNCWVSCGDGTLGEPPRQGDGQCGNMRLLLRQQQRILLAKSDVAGWGAFLKNPVNKNDYLGEYTGELISHREADKRGKIYDRANSSFLFDLNDQYVLDAYRKGDKLKFANHSSNPNCYAKVMLVAGDHRVGIFAKEHIEASQELFYDYRYGPEQAPAWARKPEGSKADDLSNSQGRAKKHQSH